MITTKYNNMISAFQCDFSSARDGDGKLVTLDYALSNQNLESAKRLINDIELLEELEMGLRYGRLAIVEVLDNIDNEIPDFGSGTFI